MRLLLVVLLCVLLPGESFAQGGVSGEVDEAAIRAQAVRALERANAAWESGDAVTTRTEAGLAVELLATLPLGRGHDETAGILWNAGSVAFRAGDFAVTREALVRVVDHRERTLPADHARLSHARENLAATLMSMGDLPGARALQIAVLEARERMLPADHHDLLQARGNLASLKRTLGDFPGALALYESVLASLKRTRPADHPDLIDERRNIAYVLCEMGDFAGARTLQEAILVDGERTLPADHPLLLSTQANLAVTMYRMGDLSGARALSESVLAGRERTLPADHHELLKARGNLAGTMYQMGDLVGARALYEAVTRGFERTLPADHVDLLKAWANLANTSLMMGDLSGARALFEVVIAGFERTLPENHPELLLARGNLAKTMRQMGDLPGALALEEAVLEAFERTLPPDHPGLLRAREAVARTMIQLGDLEGGRALREAVLAGFERTLPAGHPFLLAARLSLALTIKQMGDTRSARTARTMGLNLARGMLIHLEFLSTLSPREAREATRNEISRHSRVRFLTEPEAAEPVETIRFDLAETLRATSILPLGATGKGNARRREISAMRARLNDLVGGGPGEGQTSEAFAAEISRLTLERDRLEREIRGALAKRDSSRGTVRAEDLASVLPADAAAVGFVRHQKWFLDSQTSMILSAGDVLAAHVLFPDGALVEVELGRAEELEELARDWRAALGKPVERGFVLEASEVDRERETGEALRARILDPILARLPDETTTLHVCLDDFLHLVPIGALPIGPKEGGERLRDRLRIVNEVSFTRLMNAPTPVVGQPSLLAMGGVKFSLQSGDSVAEASAQTDRSARPQSFAPLIQTRFEAESVWALFDEEVREDAEAVLLTKKNATKAAFHKHAPGKRYLHIATHGWFAPETVASTLDARPREADALWSPLAAKEVVTGLAPMTLCGLAFAGANQGRDSLGRMPGIMTAEELAGIDLSACDLAVLSACETNVGIRRAGQGVQSLQSALHAAGVRTAITSLWKVDDALTRRLMELFYTYLWEDGLAKSDALWKAKCDLRNEGAAVRDWAGWVLSGDPR